MPSQNSNTTNLSVKKSLITNENFEEFKFTALSTASEDEPKTFSSLKKRVPTIIGTKNRNKDLETSV